MLPEMTWLNEPPHWTEDDGVLTVTTGSRTDFWRRTHYGFVHDDGHFRHATATGDFTLQATFGGGYEVQYDQVGLMVRADEEHWVKAGVEFTEGALNLSTVLTRGHSDWSVVPLAHTGEVTLRVIRTGDALNVQYLDGDAGWRLLRLGYLPLPESCQVGVMCCSPEREGFRAVFRDLTLSAEIPGDLHA
ncbi:DUF1349 domain-containing protein [Nocardiopsis sp. CA-288880]|uniref:DUF1349 domain-containing protein n=1 Tax=Nocardiopsis sp. CA-288880 TaxID=3239995 RepID=UPI003D967B2F